MSTPLDENPDITDQEKLNQIFLALGLTLKNIDRSRYIVLAIGLRESLHDAWLELERNGTLRTLGAQLAELSDETRSMAGLSGTQLRPKHFGFMDSYYQLNYRGGVSRLKKVIRWGKTILGSIATLTPGIKEAAEIIKEYIEAVEMGIEKAEEN